MVLMKTLRVHWHSNSKLNIVLFYSITGPVGKEFYFMFLANVGYQTASDRLDVMIATDSAGWVVLEVPYFNIYENRSFDDNGVVLHVHTSLRLSTNNQIEGKGVHIYSSVDISVFVLDAKLYKTEGYYVLPSITLSNDYIVTSYPFYYYNSLIGITANKDNTTVNISGYTNGTTFGVCCNRTTITITLDRLQTYQVSSIADLSGTQITSNHPVAVVTGNQCGIHSTSSRCQPLYEQMIPVKSWGKKFLVPALMYKYITSFYIRVFASQTNTFVTIQGNSMGYRDYNVSANSYVQVMIKGNAIVTANLPVSVYAFLYRSSSYYIGFAITIPAISHFSLEYYFQIPRNHSYWYNSYASIIVKSSTIDNILLDGRGISNLTSTVTTSQIGNDIYTETKLSMNMGNHKLNNSAGEEMGILLFGYTLIKGQTPGYGYVGGLGLV